MPIYQGGQLNSAALTAPGVYVSVVPPAPSFLNGVPTNGLGLVGSASWGAVGSPVVVGSPQQFQSMFGALQNRANDLGTALNIAVQQGANYFACVRVTDGTDTAASIVVQATCITFTSKYTGSYANNTIVTLAAGSQVGTWQVTVAQAGWAPENYNNIGAGLSGNALWIAIAAAINNGNSALRGPSNLVVASAGAGTAAPTAASYTLSGGTDGVTSITTSVMVGQNTVPRTGMYALQGTGVSVGLLCDLTDETSFASQIAFGLANGILMVSATVSGDTIANAASTKATNGIDSYAMKLCLGDWVYWLDTVNSATRLVSPASFAAGFIAAQSPQNGTLNKQIQGVVGTQKSVSQQVYTYADIQALVAAGIDVIANPSPGGPYFALQTGHNTSSNALIHTDAYTRMTNFIAATLNAGMGPFIGLLNSASVQAEALATVGAFLNNLQVQGMIGNPQGTVPYSVQINAANNPPSQVALGYLQINVQVQYLAVIEELLVNVQGGSSVQIQSTLPLAA